MKTSQSAVPTAYSRATALRIAVLLAVLTPLCVLAVVLAVRIGPHFAAGSDNAVNELRLRDIGTHPVLLGPYARDGWSHPGPAVYYALVVGYRLAGSTSIGMYLTALVINGGSIAGILVLSRRFGGNSLFALNALAMAVLIHHLGPQFLSDPWNPYIAVLPFGAFVFCSWAAVCRARWMIPLGAALASFCVQTHIGFLPLTVPVIAWAGAAILYRAVRGEGSPLRRELLTAAIVVALMWLPPVIQELTAERGNLSVLWSYFRHPKQPIHSVTQGYRMVAHFFSLDAEWWHPHRWGAVAGTVPKPATVVPVVLVVFLAASIPTLRRGPSAARALVGAIASTVFAAILTIWRMPGPLNDYRFGWLPLLSTLAASTAAWLVWLRIRVLLGQPRFRPVRICATAVLIVGIAGVSMQNVGDARVVRLQSSTAAGADVVPTLLSRARHALPTRRGQIIVTSMVAFNASRWFNPAAVLWLEERGYDARVPDDHALNPSIRLYDDGELTFGAHRVCDGSRVAGELMITFRSATNGRPQSIPGYRIVAATHWDQFEVPYPLVMQLYLRTGPGKDPAIRCRLAT